MRNKDSKRSVLHSIKRNTWNDTITSETAETLANAVNRRITYRHSDTVASIASLEGETPGSVELSEEECEALYREIGDRYKWFTRFYVSNGRKEHVQFFNETDCSYNVRTSETRIPGVVRGPDQTDEQLPDDISFPVGKNTYLIPVHQAVQHGPFMKVANRCGRCSPDVFSSTMPEEQVERHGELEKPFICPECGEESPGFRKGRFMTGFIHRSPGRGSRAENCEAGKNGERQYMDWLTGASPGDTLKTPMKMPTEPTTTTGGFEVAWLPPADPITTPPTESDSDLPPLVSINHADIPAPVAVLPTDINALKNTLRS